MEFCPECDALLYPSKKTSKSTTLICKSCGYEIKLENEVVDEEYKINTKGKKLEDIVFIEDDEEIHLPQVNEYCEKCGNNRAYYKEEIMDSEGGDIVTFYRCTRCGHTWREE
ncbi:MAG: transcription factor S [Candidatus Lokiarchaeota archaeon]|nr:transcription factor S [Candidatus Lokiarchaeota archaeon]